MYDGNKTPAKPAKVLSAFFRKFAYDAKAATEEPIPHGRGAEELWRQALVIGRKVSAFGSVPRIYYRELLKQSISLVEAERPGTKILMVHSHISGPYRLVWSPATPAR